jgi:hypothetical protein
MTKKLVALLTATGLSLGLLMAPVFAEDEAPKYKIKDVMKAALKGPLLKKVASGDASEAEKKELHEMLVALSKNSPPKGEADSWKELTGALVKAGQAAVEGTEGAGEMLTKAANCKACHTNHKP